MKPKEHEAEETNPLGQQDVKISTVVASEYLDLQYVP